MQRLLGSPAGLEQRGEVGAGGDLGDLQLDRARARVPAPGAVAVAVGGALGAPLVGRGTDLAGDLGLHHRLGEHPDAFTQQIHVVFLEQLADERRDVHPGGGHRPSSLTVLSMRMAVAIYVTGISTPELHLESPPLLGTLTTGGQGCQ